MRQNQRAICIQNQRVLRDTRLRDLGKAADGVWMGHIDSAIRGDLGIQPLSLLQAEGDGRGFVIDRHGLTRLLLGAEGAQSKDGLGKVIGDLISVFILLGEIDPKEEGRVGAIALHLHAPEDGAEVIGILLLLGEGEANHPLRKRSGEIGFVDVMKAETPVPLVGVVSVGNRSPIGPGSLLRQAAGGGGKG